MGMITGLITGMFIGSILGWSFAHSYSNKKQWDRYFINQRLERMLEESNGNH